MKSHFPSADDVMKFNPFASAKAKVFIFISFILRFFIVRDGVIVSFFSVSGGEIEF